MKYLINICLIIIFFCLNGCALKVEPIKPNEENLAPNPKSCSVTIADKSTGDFACCNCTDKGASCVKIEQSNGSAKCQAGGRGTSQCSISC